MPQLVLEVPRPRAPLGALVSELVVLGKVELPLMPSSAARIIELGTDANIDAEQFAAVLRTDVTIVGNLMRVANSSRYAARTPCATLREVIVRLGFAEVRRIALALVMGARVYVVPAFAARMRETFRHSFATASFAQAIAREKRLNVEEAFMLGLLHDVGEPLVLRCLTDVAKDTGMRLVPSEVDDVVKLHHPGLGADLAEQWQLPQRVVDAIAFHHQSTQPQSNLGHVLALAEAATEALTTGDEAPFRTHPSLEVLSLYRADVDAILAQIPSIREACEVLK